MLNWNGKKFIFSSDKIIFFYGGQVPHADIFPSKLEANLFLLGGRHGNSTISGTRCFLFSRWSTTTTTTSESCNRLKESNEPPIRTQKTNSWTSPNDFLRCWPFFFTSLPILKKEKNNLSKSCFDFLKRKKTPKCHNQFFFIFVCSHWCHITKIYASFFFFFFKGNIILITLMFVRLWYGTLG